MDNVVELKPKHSKKKIYIILGILFFVTAVLVYINLVHSAYTKSLNLNKSGIMSVEDSGYIFKKCGKNVITCGHDGITAINKKGEIVWKKAFGTNLPYMVTADKYILTADLNGNNCAVFSDTGKQLTNKKLPYPIITANVNENGYFSVAIKERGYKSQVIVWNVKGEQIYAWHSAKYHVISLALTNNDNGMIVSVFDVEGDENSAFKTLYFSFDKDTPVEIESGKGNLVANLRSIGDRIYAVGDTAFYAYNESGKKVFEVNYNGRTLQKYAMAESAVVLALTKTSVEGYYGGSVVEIYSSSGYQKGKYEIDDEITFLDVDEHKILVNSPEGAYILSDNGRLYGTLTFGNEVREGIIFDKGKKLLLVNGSNVNVYDAK